MPQQTTMPQAMGGSNYVPPTLQDITVKANKYNLPKLQQQQQKQPVQHLAQPAQKPQYQYKAGIDLAESRRLAIERIKAYNKKFPTQKPQVKTKLPPLHAGIPQVVLQKPNGASLQHTQFQKPRPELIQPTFKNYYLYKPVPHN